MTPEREAELRELAAKLYQLEERERDEHHPNEIGPSALLVEALDAVAALRKEIADSDASFDLRWNADMRAIKQWQEATGKTEIWPGHDDLCVFLLEKNRKLEELNDKILTRVRSMLMWVPKEDTNRMWFEELNGGSEGVSRS